MYLNSEEAILNEMFSCNDIDNIKNIISNDGDYNYDDITKDSKIMLLNNISMANMLSQDFVYDDFKKFIKEK